MPKCETCGATGDLAVRRWWIGGKGYVISLECRDLDGCAERFDTARAERIAALKKAAA